jgi:hypothetical protein
MSLSGGLNRDFAGGLVSSPKKYRCWVQYDRSWRCTHTTDSLKAAKQHGGLVLEYPLEPPATNDDD